MKTLCKECDGTGYVHFSVCSNLCPKCMGEGVREANEAEAFIEPTANELRAVRLVLLYDAVDGLAAQLEELLERQNNPYSWTLEQCLKRYSGAVRVARLALDGDT